MRSIMRSFLFGRMSRRSNLPVLLAIRLHRRHRARDFARLITRHVEPWRRGPEYLAGFIQTNTDADLTPPVTGRTCRADVHDGAERRDFGSSLKAPTLTVKRPCRWCSQLPTARVGGTATNGFPLPIVIEN